MREIKFRAWDSEQKVMRCNPDPQVIQAVIFGNDYEGRVKIMQFTGLKDKNDKEIYEGDIVKWGSGSWIGEVVYFEGAWEIGMKGREYPLQRIGGYRGKVEVIGNIYENPELLEKERTEKWTL